jgi:hypothetical protein
VAPLINKIPHRGGPVPLEGGYLDMSVARRRYRIPSGYATDRVGFAMRIISAAATAAPSLGFILGIPVL